MLGRFEVCCCCHFGALHRDPVQQTFVVSCCSSLLWNTDTRQRHVLSVCSFRTTVKGWNDLPLCVEWSDVEVQGRAGEVWSLLLQVS